MESSGGDEKNVRRFGVMRNRGRYHINDGSDRILLLERINKPLKTKGDGGDFFNEDNDNIIIEDNISLISKTEKNIFLCFATCYFVLLYLCIK